MTSQSSRFEYDRVAYPGAADPSIHLRNLEVNGLMFGASPAALSDCRVLEIGCADGTNLLPYACEFSESKFVGIDLAEDRIRVATEIADEAGINNIEFRRASVSELDASIGEFDYILCPGVFSWVGEDDRNAILRICRECLAPDGMAAISYNTLPGWNWNRSLREFVRQTVARIDDPEKKITAARNAIDFLVANVPSNSLHAVYYKRARDRLRSQSDWYFYHDYLTDQNQPFYFHEFSDRAQSCGLKFIGEADYRHSSGFGLEIAGREAVAKTPIEHREQLLDFLLNNGYRNSMLCRQDVSITLRPQHEWISELPLALLDPMEGFAFDAAGSEPVTLPFDNGAVTVTDPMVKAAIRWLMDGWPQVTTVNELFASIRGFAATLPQGSTAIDAPETLSRTMLAFCGAGLIRVFKTPPRCVDEVTEFPEVSAVARATASRGLEVVNRWHQNIRNLEVGQRNLLGLLDGTRNVESLTSALRAKTDSPASNEREIRAALESFAKKRLLIG